MNASRVGQVENMEPAHTLSFHDAWSIWWSGKRLADDAVVLGYQVIWLGRSGLFVAFIGTVMVVTDVVGAERFQRANEKTKDATNKLTDLIMINFIERSTFVLINIPYVLLVGLVYYVLHSLLGVRSTSVDYTAICLVLLPILVLFFVPIGLLGGTLIAIIASILSNKWIAPLFRVLSWILLLFAAVTAMLSA
jgi:hypothetical protein